MKKKIQETNNRFPQGEHVVGFFMEQTFKGTESERKTFSEVIRHYEMAKQDLDNRIVDFDKRDILFRSHIEESDWPYRALVFDPRVFTTLFEKTSRIIANKPRGRLVPREGGDALGAKINNEILDFQWEDNERVDNMPMIAKWQLMDMNARKYGASFAISKWHYQTELDDKKIKVFFDGPNFRPLNNRDCLPNPSYSTIKNWFQYREYVTLDELMYTNDVARGKPVYKNLDSLRDTIRKEDIKGGDNREYTIKNKSIKNLTDFLGQDEVYKVVEIVTEMRTNRWITFAPKHGVVIRDIPNPYKHGQIPVVMLKYYPIDDDLYGLSEIEPIEKLQKAINALVCQYLDAVNMSLYAPLKINQTGGAVQMHTLTFGPGAKWLMNTPASDVMAFDQNITGVQEFTSTYRFLVSALQEAMGETSQGISNLAPGQADKTATEIKDLALSRNARDNYNRIFLSEALKKQMMFWFKMNQQFLFSNEKGKSKILRITSKDAIKYFQNTGLDASGLDDGAIENIVAAQDMPEEIRPNINMEEMMQPLYPIETENGIENKMEVENDGSSAQLHLEPDDLSGNYDYIADVESMSIPNDGEILAAKEKTIALLLNPAAQQMLMAEQYKIKFKEYMEDYMEQLGAKDAGKYFEKIQQPMMGGVNVNPAGQTGAETGGMGMGNVPSQGMVGNPQAVPNGQANPNIPGPGAVYGR